MRRKGLALIGMVLLMVCIAAVALADPQLLIPENRQILSVSNGMVHFEWVPTPGLGTVLEIFDTDGEYVFSDAVEAGVGSYDLPVSGILQADTPYMLGIMDDNRGTDYNYFAITYGGGSSVNWGATGPGSPRGINTEGLNDKATVDMTDALNRLIDMLYEMDYEYFAGNSIGIIFAESEDNFLIRPMAINVYGYRMPSSQSNMVELTEFMLGVMEDVYNVQLEHGEEGDHFPFSNRYMRTANGEIPGGIEIKPLNFNKTKYASGMVFALVNEDGTKRMDGALYYAFCAQLEGGLLEFAIITDQSEIAELLEKLGIDREKLLAELPWATLKDYSREELTELLKNLIDTGEAQSQAQTQSDEDFYTAAHDESSDVGQRYRRILWENMDDVVDQVLEAISASLTSEELEIDHELQLELYKALLYQVLQSNTENIAEPTELMGEYIAAIAEAYVMAESAADVDEVRSALEQLGTGWVDMFSSALEKTDLKAQSDMDLALLCCIIAEQYANQATLNDIAAAAEEQSILREACDIVSQEIAASYSQLIGGLSAPVSSLIHNDNLVKQAQERATNGVTFATNALVLYEMNADVSAMGILYGEEKARLELEALSLELVQLGIVRNDLYALVDRAYNNENGTGGSLYVLTKLYLAADNTCLAATESFFGSVDRSWFGSAFVNEKITNAKAGVASVTSAQKDVEEERTTLRTQRAGYMSTRRRDTDVAMGRNPPGRSAVVNTGKDPLTLRDKPSQQSGTLALIPKGAVVTVLEEGAWPLVDYEGMQGYVNGKYLK